ncbi:28S ribosomal protein S34, mitochondrial [Esox lucius]|uniref:Mitochondrial 28S ribosomal protein S34 n=1 Tax=Esox lucius TaxID=8010 RepID=C1BWF1_ESOLU|nr:28S ribosomal protein S34, mitochondrial [Esox lucius]ACO13354.1 Mitochondrial 28S ribosomal protein S34 [Esox lucius]
MVKKKRVRLIAEMARKVRAYRALKNQPRESQKYALDYNTMTRPHTGKILPILAWQDARRENRLFSLLSGLRLFGVGRLFTRKSWLTEHPGAPSYWQVTKVKVDYTAENMDHGRAWGILTHKGKQVSEVKEIDKVMYHDWRLVPKHEEVQFKLYYPVPETPTRYVSYPPLLRAMILAQRQKAGLGKLAEEPILPLKRDVLLSKDYFRNREKEREREEGTAV